MRQAMAEAEVGDDVYGEDPSVNALQDEACAMFGKAAALFVTSGTQANLVALLTHCTRGDEYIVGQPAHAYRFEGGGAAALGGIQPQPLPLDEAGRFDLEELRTSVKPDDPHFARTRLVCVENTHDGIPLSPDYLGAVRRTCDEAALALHMDGARMCNAAVASETALADVCQPADTVSVCLSKGLGAPAGSLLLGPADFIAEARRWRKMLGGGLRQAGILAAAGRYALQHNVQRLKQDHERAGRVAAAIRAVFGDQAVTQHTNMLFLQMSGPRLGSLIRHLRDHGIRITRSRMVLHKDVNDDDVSTICSAFEAFRTSASEPVA